MSLFLFLNYLFYERLKFVMLIILINYLFIFLVSENLQTWQIYLKFIKV